jgi:hypothetical protein
MDIRPEALILYLVRVTDVRPGPQKSSVEL